MSSLNFMVYGLTDIVEKTCTLCKLYIHAKLSGHKACQMSNLDRMLKNILTIACTIFESSEKLDKLRMKIMDTKFKCCGFTFGFDDGIDFFFGIVAPELKILRHPRQDERTERAL